MNAMCRKLLSLGLILSFSQLQAWGAEDESELNERLPYTFSVESSDSFYPRYENLITISFQNATRHSLNKYRIFAMQLIDPNEPYVPGNVVEHIWSFVHDTEEVVLPLSNLAFTLVVYKGLFGGDLSDREVIEHKESKQVFFLDGDEMDSNVKAIRLTVH